MAVIVRPASLASVMRQYEKLLDEIISEMMRVFLKEFRRAESLIIRVDSETTELDRALAAMRASPGLTEARVRAVSNMVADRVSTHNDRSLRKQLAGVGLNVAFRDAKSQSILDSFVSNTQSSVSNLSGFVETDVRRRVLKGFSEGETYASIVSGVVDRFDVARGRAATIVRSSISALNGQLTAARHQSIGITSFIWRTVNDERVRFDHENRDGEQYRYDDPPDGELPGEPINCRCYAEPVLADIL